MGFLLLLFCVILFCLILFLGKPTPSPNPPPTKSVRPAKGTGRTGQVWGGWFCRGLRVFLFVDLFSGPGCSPKSSQYTVLVSRRLNPEEERGARTSWLPQYGGAGRTKAEGSHPGEAVAAGVPGSSLTAVSTWACPGRCSLSMALETQVAGIW